MASQAVSIKTKKLIMKRFLFLLSLTTCLFTSGSFANEDHLYPEFLKTFFTSFPSAKKVSWMEVDGLTRVNFELENKSQYAYFNAAGFMVITAMPVSISELPAVLQQSLRVYDGFSITESYMFTKGKHRYWFVVLKKDKRQIILKSSGKKWNRFHTEH